MNEFFAKLESDVGIVKRRPATIPPSPLVGAAVGAVFAFTVSTGAAVAKPQSVDAPKHAEANCIYTGKFASVLARVVRFSRLATGWDGPGSLPPSSRAQNAARAVVKAFARAADTIAATPQVAPSPEGGYQFEWRNGARELYVTCTPEGAYEIMECGPEEAPEHVADDAALIKAIEWLSQA